MKKKILVISTLLIGLLTINSYANGGCDGPTLSNDLDGAAADFCRNCYDGAIALVSDLDGNTRLLIYDADC